MWPSSTSTPSWPPPPAAGPSTPGSSGVEFAVRDRGLLPFPHPPDAGEMKMRRRIIPVCWLLLSAILAAGQSTAWARETQGPQMSAVVAEIGRIGKTAKGTVGVAAIHLETGRRVVFHAD